MADKADVKKRKVAKEEISQPPDVSPDFSVKRPPASACTTLLFIILSISLFLAIGTLSITLDKNTAYHTGSSKSVPGKEPAAPSKPSVEKLVEKPVENVIGKDSTSGNKEKLLPLNMKEESESQSHEKKHVPKETLSKLEDTKQAANPELQAKVTSDPKTQTKAEESKPTSKQGKPNVPQSEKQTSKKLHSKDSVTKQGVKDAKPTKETVKQQPKSTEEKIEKAEKSSKEIEKEKSITTEKKTTDEKLKKTSTEKNEPSSKPVEQADSKENIPSNSNKSKVSKDAKVKEQKKSSEEVINDTEHEAKLPRKDDKSALLDLYLQVEKLADEILEKDPENDVIKQLSPHFESTLRDIEEGKIAGITEGLLHIQKLLVDLKVRVEETLKETASKKSLPKESDDDSPPGKKPVDEKVPDPVYIAPRESQPPVDQSSVKKTLDTTEQPKSSSTELKRFLTTMPKDPNEALTVLTKYLEEHPNSSEVMFEYAKIVDKLSGIEKSNARLEQAIYAYRNILDLSLRQPGSVPHDILRQSGILCAERMGFRGFQSKATRVLQQLIEIFPSDIEIQNKLGVQLLMMNQPKAAREVFYQILSVTPDDGFAQAHYGFALKTEELNYTEAIKYLKAGIESGAPGTKDGRFYFQLGDAYQRIGENDKAYEVFDKGAKEGLFLNKYQRSLYNIDRLKSQPVWTLEETTYQVFFRKLEKNWEKIRDEGLKALKDNRTFQPETENLKDTGDWKQFELFARGKKNIANCNKAPFTCGLINDFKAAAGCKRGQVKFSVMEPGTHVWPHTGPTNCRLRAHLGLVIPKGLSLRVGNKMLTWSEGKVIVFDDSWEHEVWHKGDMRRLVLIVDVWHPDITDSEQKTLTPI